MAGDVFDSDRPQRELLGAEFVEAAADGLGSGGEAFRAFQRRYRDDPAAFARDCVEWPAGEGLTPYQAEILAAIPEKRRVAVRAPHGVGKSALAALAALWFATTRDGSDWKVLTTASAWRQLSKYLWPEVAKWAGRLRWDVIGRDPFSTRHELMTLSLKLESGEAFAVASDDAGLVEGAHADEVLLVIDEGKSVPPAMWDALEGVLAGQGASYALAISTPGARAGRFFEIHDRKEGVRDWCPCHVTLEDAIAAGRISREWAEQRRKQWGPESSVFKNRVLGEFCADDEDGVIPAAWVEAAVERWHAWCEAGKPGEFVALGVDLARSGRDRSAFAPRIGAMIDKLERWSYADAMTTTGRVAAILQRRGGVAVVDVIGLGGPVLDRLREQGLNAIAFNASEASDATDRSGELRFLNRRAEAWWKLREALDPAFEPVLGLPDDDELLGDLTAPRWRINSSGRIQIESKDEIRKRIGRSTDAGDAVVQVLAHSARQSRRLDRSSFVHMPRRAIWKRSRVWDRGR